MCWLLVGQYNRRIQGRKMADAKGWYAHCLLSAACFYCSRLDAAFRIQCWMRLLRLEVLVGRW